MPGDPQSLVESKRRSRKRIIDLYNKMNPNSIRLAYQLARKISKADLPDLDLDHAKNGDNKSKTEIKGNLKWGDEEG